MCFFYLQDLKETKMYYEQYQNEFYSRSRCGIFIFVIVLVTDLIKYTETS